MKMARPLILLVEDDPDTAILYRALLGSEGYQVATCYNQAEAWAWWEAHGPDQNLVLVVDVRLPDGSGLELLKEIMRQAEPANRPRVLMLSAHGDPRLPVACRKAGASAYLDKLCEPDLFLDTVRSLVN
jgi:DNA-binding response OmpR family regulator